MMYAKIINDSVVTFGELPNCYGRYTNFPEAGSEAIHAEGFWEVEFPVVPEGKMLGELYYDEISNLFKYHLIDLPNKPWHDAMRGIQLIITDGQKADWLQKLAENEILGTYPDIAILIGVVKNLDSPKVQVDGKLYLYLAELYPAHKAFLKQYGIEINYKE